MPTDGSIILVDELEDLEGSARGAIDILLCYLPSGTEENHEIPQSG
jgi:hypothetical protein